MKKNILMGYMGCGKSTVGKILHQKSMLPYTDLDAEIVKSAGSPINEIFSKKGEIYFRKLEHQILKEVLSNQHSAIISLGGGTPCYGNNLQLINLPGHNTFYLKASAETLLDRLQKDPGTRPLLAHSTLEKQIELINKHLFERNFFYTQAKYVIVTDNKEPEEIAAEIYSLI